MNHTVRVSFFASETDTRPQVRELDLDELIETLTKHTPRSSKRRGALWSPFTFNGLRKGANMLESALLSFDIDDGTPPSQVAGWLQGLTYFVASTHSSTPEHWKLRVGIVLTEPIPAADFASVWHSAVAELLHGHVDPSTHDLARIFYLPTHKPDIEPYASVVYGEPLDWRQLPRWSPPERPSLPDLEGIEGLDAGVERRRGKAMLQKWCLDLANCDAGLRHEAILRLGRAAGGLVGSGALSYDEVYAEFLDAADAAGEVADHGSRDVDRSIRAALDFGAKQPWTPSQFGDSDDWINAPQIMLTRHQSSANPTHPDPTVKNGMTGLDDDLLEAFTIRQERELTPEEVVWIIEGWLGKGMMTELVAKVKLGKTTWALQGLRAFMLGDESFCGQTISKAGKVLYVTEEGRQTFHEALQRYGLWDDLNDEMVIAYDFLMADMPLNVAVNKMLRTAAKHEVDVVVIDTLTTIAGLDDEDNSGRVGSAMREFRRLANAGYAVFVLRHGRKIGGEVGDAGRGSSAISGAVDILLQIDPFKGEDDDSNLRILRARGRMKATPTDPLTLEFDKETERYRLVGGVRSKEERIAAAVLEGLEQLEAIDQEHGVTVLTLKAKIGKREQAIRDELKHLVEDGRARSGDRPTGKGGTPAKIYWLPTVIQIHPDQSSRPAEALARTRARTDSEGVQNTSNPVFDSGVGMGRSTGPDEPKPAPRPKREKTPEAVAKAAEQKAARELAKLEAADAAAPKIEYLVVPRDGSLDDVLGKLISGKCGTAVLSLDTETTGLSAKRDRLRTIQISDGTTHVVIDVWAYEGRFPSAIVNEWLEYVAEVRMHTYLFDLAFLQQVGVTIDPAKIYDVRTAAVVLESKEDWTDYRLQGIAKRHLHEHVSKVEQRKGWDATTLRHAKLAYAAEDARVTFAAGSVLASTLATDADVDALWSCLALERNVQAATWWLASAGAPADRGVMAEAVAEQESVMANLHAMLTGEVGGNVNWRSPKQVLPLLQQHGLDVSSTNEGALMDAIGDEAPDPFIRALLDYRSAGACLGLLRNAQNAIQDDGRIYASFNPIGAQTGRTACSEPNLQNLPHHTRAREAIRPPAGRVFVRADYSQLQLVIAAQIAQDQEMLRILNEPDGDIHQRTADAVGCTRQQAKAVNFGFLFGSGAETFQREQRKNGVYMTLEQAHRYRTLFMRTYRGIRQWHRSLGEWGDETAVIDPSGSGRRRAAIFSNNVKANTPVQMVEAHGFKLALSQLYETRHEVPSARLVMMVHDEIIAECDEADVSRCRSWLGGNMAQAMNSILDGVKARVDVKVVRSYADADKDGVHA